MQFCFKTPYNWTYNPIDQNTIHVNATLSAQTIKQIHPTGTVNLLLHIKDIATCY